MEPQPGTSTSTSTESDTNTIDFDEEIQAAEQTKIKNVDRALVDAWKEICVANVNK